jgi:hypothetical protein
MEHRVDTLQTDPQPRTAAFGDRCAKSDEKRLDIGPPHIGSNGIREDRFKRPPLLRIHPE